MVVTPHTLLDGITKDEVIRWHWKVGYQCNI